MKHQPRRSLKRDKNHKAIVDELIERCYSVLTLSTGADILVGKDGSNFLFEIKNPQVPPSARQLTPAEVNFHTKWRGQINIVFSVDGVIKVIEDRLNRKVTLKRSPEARWI